MRENNNDIALERDVKFRGTICGFSRHVSLMKSCRFVPANLTISR